MHDYMVKVKHISNFDPSYPDGCKEYMLDDLEKNCKMFGKQCQIVILPGFVPKNNAKNNLTVDDELAETQAYDTILSIVEMESYPAREKCNKLFTVSKSNFFLDEFDLGKKPEAVIRFKFAEEVVQKTSF